MVYIHIIIQAQVNGMIGHCVKTDMHQCRQGLKVARHYLSRHLKHTQQTPAVQYSERRNKQVDGGKKPLLTNKLQFPETKREPDCRVKTHVKVVGRS